MIDYSEAVKLYTGGYTLREAARSCGVGYTKFQEYMSKTGKSRSKRKNSLVGDRFGSLLVAKEELVGDRDRHWWCWCECTCGGRQKFRRHQLLKNTTTMCGRCRASGGNSVLWKGHGGISGTYWAGLQRGASTRNISFNISIEYAWKIYEKQGGKCTLSGISIPMGKNARTRAFASLDRINSSAGYIEGNVQWVHKALNRMKLDTPVKEFVNWCCLVSEHQKIANYAIALSP